MGKTKNKLTAMMVNKLGHGTHADGAGLYLQKQEGGSSWLYRYSFQGKRSWMGLGSTDALSLAEARRARDQWARVLQDGLDPRSERERRRAEEAANLGKDDPTFEEVALKVFDARKGALREDGVRGRWWTPLRLYAIPKIGKRRISTLDRAAFEDVLRPIWKSKPPSAQKLAGRLKLVLHQARLMGYEIDPFQLEAAIFSMGTVRHKVQHIPATDWRDMPDLFEKLRGVDTVSSLMVQFQALTVTRNTSAFGARFDEIEGDVWTVPEERMKGSEGHVREFRIPLSRQALAIVDARRDFASGDLIFESPHRSKGARPLTDVAVAKVLNKLGEAGRPHGFRTSFRTWVQDTEAASYDVAETALAHTIGGKVERSYARSDMLDSRRVLMQAWADYVTGEAAGNVIPLPRRKA